MKMKKLYLLLALLGTCAAQAIKEEEKVTIVKPLLVYIKNNTAAEFKFSDVKTGKKRFSITIPAKSTGQINKQLSLAIADAVTYLALRLPIYKLMLTDAIYTLWIDKNGLFIRGGPRLGPRGSGPDKTISNTLKITSGEHFAIELNETNDKLYPQAKLIPQEITLKKLALMPGAKAILKNIMMGEETLASARKKVPEELWLPLEQEISALLQTLDPVILDKEGT